MTRLGSLTNAMILRSSLTCLAAFGWVAMLTASGLAGELGSPVSTLAASDCRPMDQIWLVSTRHLGCPNGGPPRLEVKHAGSWCDWRPSTLDEFLSADSPGVRTVIYVHGNRMDSSDAVERGERVYRQFTRGLGPDVPLRLVVWSWPSTLIHGPLKDVRAKAARTDSDAFYLGWFLSRLNPDTEVSLLGYSFGARVVTGALHVRAGGSSAGAALDPQDVMPRRRTRVALTAGAMDRDFVYPGNQHGLALSQVDQMLVMYNSQDRVLKRYRLIEQRDQAQALGYMGLEPSRLGDLAQRIKRVDANCAVGARHAESAYTSSPWVGNQLRAALLDDNHATVP